MPSGGSYTGTVPSVGVYRTELGLVFRVMETVEGGLRIDVLKEGAWVPGRIGMIGLRRDPSTTKLSPSAIRQLPP
jgi:hypothetical protein